jgi:hypothetical protein
MDVQAICGGEAFLWGMNCHAQTDSRAWSFASGGYDLLMHPINAHPALVASQERCSWKNFSTCRAGRCFMARQYNLWLMQITKL